MSAPVVLVTGATGFLGGAVAARLLEADPGLRLVALVRERCGQEASARLNRSLQRFTSIPIDERCEVITGSLDRPVTLPSPSHVVHLAVDASAGAEVNVDGTLALAARAGGRLERFVYVGSAWSCGRAAGARVREDDPPAGEPVARYLAHKLEAERRLCAVEELPLAIVRPSLVAGHTTLGTRPSASLFWVLRLVDELGAIPWPRAQRLDVVPVDWAADAIVRVTFAASSPRRCHLSAGAASPRWADIDAAFARVTGRARRYEPLPRQVWQARAEARLTDPRAQGALAACLRFLEGDTVFDTAQATASGLPAPPSIDTLIGTCVSGDERPVDVQALDDT